MRRMTMDPNKGALDLWIVQLDELIQHALKIRDENVMNYKRNAKKAFEMGINMLVLLMKSMIEDMVEELDE
jgi:hypothetical protein